MSDATRFDDYSPSRDLFVELADKWTMIILCILSHRAVRFNELKRRCGGISQKSLTQTLRRLERNGCITREVLNTSPVGVEYRITDLGSELSVLLKSLFFWANDNVDIVGRARADYDANQERTTAVAIPR
ncbi:MAG: helix-turn-helix domain-containing protein [Pseudomonadota bacterium]